MAIYRTAQGKPLDMSALSSRNEKVRAVGNMKVNARGDTIDSHGRVLVPVTKKVGNAYEQTVSNKQANIVNRDRPTAQPDPIPEPTVEVFEEIELLADELDIENDSDALEIEALKLQESEEPAFVIKPASDAPEFFEPETKTTKKK